MAVNGGETDVAEIVQRGDGSCIMDWIATASHQWANLSQLAPKTHRREAGTRGECQRGMAASLLS